MNIQFVAPARPFHIVAATALPALAATVLLCACGGSDEAEQSVASVTATSARNCTPAVVGGTIVGRSDPSFILVTPDCGGGSYLFYGPDLASTSLITGVIFAHRGHASIYPGDPRLYNATDSAQDVGYGASLALAIDAAAPAVTGSLHYRDQTATYELSGGAVQGSSYSYDRPASVADAAGAWNLTDLQANNAALSVVPDGGFSGTYQGCTLTGTMKPTWRGVNLMDLQATLTACPASRTNTLSLPYKGFAVAFPMTVGGTQLLIYATAFDEITWNGDTVVAIGRR